MQKAQIQQLLKKDLDNDVFDLNENGVYFPRQGIQVEGTYFDRINGGEWNISKNLVVKEGLIELLNTYFIASKAKPAGFYLALFSGATAPAANWTAANFTTVANEIVSQSEGYVSATRPVFTPTEASADTFVDNMANAASLTMVTSSQLNVTGVALLTSSQRGGTTGKLISATKYPAARTFQNGDIFEVGYQLAMTV